VSRPHAAHEVAQRLAEVCRSITVEHPGRAKDAIRFTLHCMIAMLAQRIGLLERQSFTKLLHESAERGDTSERLAELLRRMSLLEQPVVLPINAAQLAALTQAAEADWTLVDPHIFGTVLQAMMDDDERHATGAHYTAEQDILRVVGPTIVEPWRPRIDAATTPNELRSLHDQLMRFRVLDPACGTGDFLYVAFRELYRLETDLLVRMQDLPAHRGIPTTNFHGIDINPLAVELARATLSIAKQIAFDERARLLAPDLAPLPRSPDNLDRTILCADALFVDWPPVDAIVGNPPILGDRKIRAKLGETYIERLRQVSGVDGLVDLSCYWFRRAHDHLPSGGRAGLVGTSGLRVGKAREASLDYLVDRGGTITNAVSSMLWLGDANLDVCMVNWVNGPAQGPHRLIVEGRTYPCSRIAPHLQLHADVSGAKKLAANDRGTAMGVIFGSEAFTAEVSRSSFNAMSFVRPVATGTDTLTGALERAPTYCIHLGLCRTRAEAQALAGSAFAELERRLVPEVRAKSATYEGWLERWWQPWRPREAFFVQIGRLSRYVACSNPQKRPIFVFLSTQFVPTNTMQVFAFDDDYSFGIIQSGLHWMWLRAKGGKISVRPRYTAEVWKTFPWPQHPPADAVVKVAAAARALRETRRTLMDANGPSLRALYRSADAPGPHPLQRAQSCLDEAVAAAYDLPVHQDPLEFLLEQNLALADAEQQGRCVCGPGLPPGLDRNDSRWSSDDCIEPPARSPVSRRVRT
jgi:SAM-dependent methyltransferase